MRSLLILLLLAIAVSARAAEPLSPDQARALLERSGFTPDPEETTALIGIDRRAAIRQLVADAVTASHSDPQPPDWILTPPPRLSAKEKKELPPKEREQQRREDLERWRELRGWWAGQAITSRTPLLERMTQFWHNHFTSSLRAVKDEQMIYRQHVLLRREALGNFRRLLHQITRDPAMLDYLDNRNNRRDAPNENYARELLELFTLGEGHYREQDIKESARALTGWMVNPEGAAVWVRKRHDAGSKIIFGQRGNYGTHDLLDLILQQPRTAEFIVEKLWREFVSATPPQKIIKRLAAQFRRNWELAPLMTALLSEPALLAPENRGSLVKSPLELVAGTYRLLSVGPEDGVNTATATTALGQQLFDPPNVKGWPGGLSWINSNTLLKRQLFIERMTGDVPERDTREVNMADPVARARLQLRVAQRRFAAFAESLDPAGAQQLVLAVPPIENPPEGATPIERLRSWMLDPAYQVK